MNQLYIVLGKNYNQLQGLVNLLKKKAFCYFFSSVLTPSVIWGKESK